jgi:hypothetical protein
MTIDGRLFRYPVVTRVSRHPSRAGDRENARQAPPVERMAYGQYSASGQTCGHFQVHIPINIVHTSDLAEVGMQSAWAWRWGEVESHRLKEVRCYRVVAPKRCETTMVRLAYRGAKSDELTKRKQGLIVVRSPVRLAQSFSPLPRCRTASPCRRIISTVTSLCTSMVVSMVVSLVHVVATCVQHVPPSLPLSLMYPPNPMMTQVRIIAATPPCIPATRRRERSEHDMGRCGGM